MQFQVEDVIAHDSHDLIGFHVVHVQNVQIIETSIERVSNFIFYVDNGIEDAYLLELGHFNQIIELSGCGPDAFQLLNEH